MATGTDEINTILERSKIVAMVGLSPREDSASYRVAEYLHGQGYRVIPVNPTVSEPIFGEQPYASLRDIADHIDVVDVFRRAEATDEVIDDAIAVGADAVWLQLGIRNEAGLVRARAAGLLAVHDHCMRVEHTRYRG